MSTVGGDADEATKKQIRGALTELAEYAAEALERLGLSRFASPLFRPFNAVFGLSTQQLLCVLAPLSGGIASLYFMDSRSNPYEPTLEQVMADVQRQLGWTDLVAIQIPAVVLADAPESREKRLRALADELAQKIGTEAKRNQRRGTLRPIFGTAEDLELDETLCFVLMPFSASFDRIYYDVLEPTIRQSGLRALRADKIFSPTPIVEDIWRHIVTARLVIADVTGRNPNVFYELGLAHAVGKPVVILTQSKDDIPFDIAYRRYFRYTDDSAGWKTLAGDLTAAIEAALEPR